MGSNLRWAMMNSWMLLGVKKTCLPEQTTEALVSSIWSFRKRFGTIWWNVLERSSLESGHTIGRSFSLFVIELMSQVNGQDSRMFFCIIFFKSFYAKLARRHRSLWAAQGNAACTQRLIMRSPLLGHISLDYNLRMPTRDCHWSLPLQSPEKQAILCGLVALLVSRDPCRLVWEFSLDPTKKSLVPSSLKPDDLFEAPWI